MLSHGRLAMLSHRRLGFGGAKALRTMMGGGSDSSDDLRPSSGTPSARSALQIAAEIDDNGVMSRFGYSGGRNVPDFMIRNGVPYRILTDHLGSVRLVVNANTGAIVQRMDYDVFGKVTQDWIASGQMWRVPFGFAGGLYDPDTKLVRFGARDYDAEVGRWTAKDPIRFGGGDANLYRYAGGDPVGIIDPNGMDIWLEGASPLSEPGGHMSISIGDPMGLYVSYSFGIADDHLGGGVYEDTAHGGPILRYFPSSTAENSAAIRMIMETRDADSLKWYGQETCFSYSGGKISAIQKALKLRESEPHADGWSLGYNPFRWFGYLEGTWLFSPARPMGGLLLD